MTDTDRLAALEACGFVCGIPRSEHQTEEHPWEPLRQGVRIGDDGLLHDLRRRLEREAHHEPSCGACEGCRLLDRIDTALSGVRVGDDGLDVARSLIAAHEEWDLRAEGIEAAARAYLSRPSSPSLLDALRSALAAQPAPPADDAGGLRAAAVKAQEAFARLRSDGPFMDTLEDPLWRVTIDAANAIDVALAAQPAPPALGTGGSSSPDALGLANLAQPAPPALTLNEHGRALCVCGVSVLPENWPNHLLSQQKGPHRAA